MRNKLYPTTVLYLPLILSACTAPPAFNQQNWLKESAMHLSAGATGCLPSEIEIKLVTTHTTQWSTVEVWTATCKSSVYVCSAELPTGPALCSLRAE